MLQHKENDSHSVQRTSQHLQYKSSTSPVQVQYKSRTSPVQGLYNRSARRREQRQQSPAQHCAARFAFTAGRRQGKRAQTEFAGRCQSEYRPAQLTAADMDAIRRRALVTDASKMAIDLYVIFETHNFAALRSRSSTAASPATLAPHPLSLN